MLDIFHINFIQCDPIARDKCNKDLQNIQIKLHLHLKVKINFFSSHNSYRMKNEKF
jgi:hypothetical protein